MKNYLSLVKFSHTIFAMPFALIGFFLGMRAVQHETGHDFLLKFILVIFCMVFARSAAMAFNRYLDRHYDNLNPRTAIREIPSGIISAKNALIFTVVNCLLFIAVTFFINKLCFYLSPIALFVILFYSFTKRFTSLCHLVLGLGLSLAPIGAYIAVTGEFSWLPLMYSFTVIFWVSGFDIIYAMQDVEFDESQKLHSIPVKMGRKNALLFSTLLHVISLAFVTAAGFLGSGGIAFIIGWIIFAGMLFYQHSIVKPNDLRRVNLAFMTANGIASVVFATFVIIDIFLKWRGY